MSIDGEEIAIDKLEGNEDPESLNPSDQVLNK